MTGWWILKSEILLEALKRTHDGEDPDLIYTELYANAEVEGDGLDSEDESAC